MVATHEIPIPAGIAKRNGAIRLLGADGVWTGDDDARSTASGVGPAVQGISLTYGGEYYFLLGYYRISEPV